jgi:hypothetical protein
MGIGLRTPASSPSTWRRSDVGMRPCAGVLWVTRAGPIGTRCCPPWRGSSLLAWAIRASFGTSPASVARRRSLGTLDARAIVANLRALHAMARPGLEPGTPRFSGSRPVACLHTKGLQIRLSLAVMPRRDPVTFGRFGARLGLRGGVEVPAAEAHRGNRERSICGVCDARVPDGIRASCQERLCSRFAWRLCAKGPEKLRNLTGGRPCRVVALASASSHLPVVLGGSQHRSSHHRSTHQNREWFVQEPPWMEAVSASLLPCHGCRSATAPGARRRRRRRRPISAAPRLPMAGRGGRSGRVDRSRTAAEREPRLDRRAAGR